MAFARWLKGLAIAGLILLVLTGVSFAGSGKKKVKLVSKILAYEAPAGQTVLAKVGSTVIWKEEFEKDFDALEKSLGKSPLPKDQVMALLKERIKMERIYLDALKKKLDRDEDFVKEIQGRANRLLARKYRAEKINKGPAMTRSFAEADLYEKAAKKYGVKIHEELLAPEKLEASDVVLASFDGQTITMADYLARAKGKREFKVDRITSQGKRVDYLVKVIQEDLFAREAIEEGFWKQEGIAAKLKQEAKFALVRRALAPYVRDKAAMEAYLFTLEAKYPVKINEGALK